MSFPEHDKLKAVKEESQFIGQFLEWFIEESNMNDVPLGFYNIEPLLAKYFEIDLCKLELEKQSMLDQIRKGGSFTE